MMDSQWGSLPLKAITNYYGTCENAQSRSVFKSIAKRKLEYESSTQSYKKKVTKLVTGDLGHLFYQIRKSYEGDENAQNETIIQTKKEHSVVMEKSTEEDGSEINQLPSEILCRIFKLLPSHTRSNVRLVCKKWYDHCQDEKILVKCVKCDRKRLSDIARCLANCQFKHLNLSFYGELASKLPVTLWRKIGSKVRSLECQLATNTMKNIVAYCDNLQRLYLHVSLGQDEACDLITTLDDLVNNNAVNRELNTLEINITNGITPMYLSSNTMEIWRRIFQTIYRLFPNIITFSFSRRTFRFENSVEYRCKFSRAKYSFNQIEDSSLASIFADLAFSIFSQDDWLKSLDKMSGLRLNTFELIFRKKTYTNEDEIHLRHFLVNQRYLTSVCMDFSAWIGAEMLRSVLFEIIKNCLDLKRLRYVSLCREHYLTFTDFTFLLRKMARVKSVSVSGFSMDRSSVTSSTSSIPISKISALELANVNETIYSCFIRNYSRLQHLTIRSPITDMVLQNIFKYSTELKVLNVKLHHSCTNFGITGHRPMSNSNVNAYPGYSINRLRNLEKLVICFEDADNVDDKVIMDFTFPKLRYLHCMKEMKQCEVIVGMASKVPLLQEIKFPSNNMTITDMINVCQHMENLYHLHADFQFFSYEVEMMFNMCPRLRMITDFGCRVQYYNSVDSENIIKNLY